MLFLHAASFGLYPSRYSNVHFGLTQNEPKTHEEFNAIGLVPIAALFSIFAKPISESNSSKDSFCASKEM